MSRIAILMPTPKVSDTFLAKSVRHQLSGRVALVTGASRGLGAAMADALAQAGASVIRWAKHTRASIQSVDVTDERAVNRAVSQVLRRFRRIDVLINNAGIWDGDEFPNLKVSTWRKVIDADLTSPFLVSKAVLPAMRRQRYGKIIHISSTSGLITHPHGGAYGTAKAGLLHLTRIMAVELGRYGIRVNAIAPGTFRTDMTADVFADRAWIAKRKRRIPLGRFGEPHDLEGLVVFLASKGSDYITGQTFVIDGGASLGA